MYNDIGIAKNMIAKNPSAAAPAARSPPRSPDMLIEMPSSDEDDAASRTKEETARNFNAPNWNHSKATTAGASKRTDDSYGASKTTLTADASKRTVGSTDFFDSKRTDVFDEEDAEGLGYSDTNTRIAAGNVAGSPDMLVEMPDSDDEADNEADSDAVAAWGAALDGTRKVFS
jgi:hypothetical protein